MKLEVCYVMNNSLMQEVITNSIEEVIDVITSYEEESNYYEGYFYFVGVNTQEEYDSIKGFIGKYDFLYFL